MSEHNYSFLIKYCFPDLVKVVRSKKIYNSL